MYTILSLLVQILLKKNPVFLGNFTITLLLYEYKLTILDLKLLRKISHTTKIHIQRFHRFGSLNKNEIKCIFIVVSTTSSLN